MSTGRIYGPSADEDAVLAAHCQLGFRIVVIFPLASSRPEIIGEDTDLITLYFFSFRSILVIVMVAQTMSWSNSYLRDMEMTLAACTA